MKTVIQVKKMTPGIMRAVQFCVTAILLIQCSTGPGSQSTDQSQNRYESVIQNFEKLDQETPVSPGAILFVGSSSIRMWRTLETDFPEYRVINRGFGGSELSDVLHYFDRVVVPYHPRQIFLYEGDNDVTVSKSAENIFADFKNFVALTRQKLPGTPIVFISIKPSASRLQFLAEMDAANQLIRLYCEDQDDLTFMDVFHPMLSPAQQPLGEYFIADSLHMNAAGYKLWQSPIAPCLIPEQP